MISAKLTASQILYRAAGSPPQEGLEPNPGPCATCGAPMEEGLPTDAINNPTFSQHGDFFRFSSHVCPACAWLYRLGKSKPGNVLAAGKLYNPTIAPNEGRQTWLEVLREVAALSPETPVAGILTTDPKPRLWPRVRPATIGRFGLYVHAPDYDTSAYLELRLPKLLEGAELIGQALRLGFSKQSVLFSLWRDHARATKNWKEVGALERSLSALRCEAEFIPALTIARKEEHGNPAWESIPIPTARS